MSDNRKQIKDLVTDDFDRALSMAANISDPWDKTQSLAHIALHAKDESHRLKIINLAFKSALDCPNPNRIVTVSCWPLKALAKLGFEKEIKLETERLLFLISKEENPVSQGDALFMMLGATCEGPKDNFLKVLDSFLANCKIGHSWKLDRSCLTLCSFIAKFEPALLKKVQDHIKDERIKRKVEGDIEKYKTLLPHQLLPNPYL